MHSRHEPSGVSTTIVSPSRSGILGTQESDDAGHLLDSDELLRWLRRKQHLALHGLLGDAARLRGVGDLHLEGHRLREAGDAVLRRDVG
jgi:hypothetical protein